MSGESVEPPAGHRGLEQRLSDDVKHPQSTTTDTTVAELLAHADRVRRKQLEERARAGIPDPPDEPAPVRPIAPAVEPAKPSPELVELLELVIELGDGLDRAPGVAELFERLRGTREQRRRLFGRAVSTGYLRREPLWDASGRRKLRDQVLVTEAGWRLLELA